MRRRPRPRASGARAPRGARA
uniref:Uncharacterized protein n=1 Tax=Arundo donax TaxID=35708 RepID=A0A0A9EA13_ARUDO